MNAEIEHLAKAVERKLADVQQGEWACEPGINTSLVSRAIRDELKTHFEQLGYEVRYEKRMESGQRLRGFWVRKKQP